MCDMIIELKSRAVEAQDIGAEDAFTLYKLGIERPFFLMAAAAEIREHFKSKNVNFCGIVNAKSGICGKGG